MRLLNITVLLLLVVVASVCAFENGFAETAEAEVAAVVAAPEPAATSTQVVAEAEVDLSKLSLVDLHLMLDKAADDMKQGGADVRAGKKDMWLLRQKTRREDKAVLAIREEIRALKKNLEVVLNQNPAVQEKAVEIAATEENLKKLMKKRQNVLRAIAVEEAKTAKAAAAKSDAEEAVAPNN